MSQRRRIGKLFNKIKFGRTKHNGPSLSRRGELVKAHHQRVVGVKFVKSPKIKPVTRKQIRETKGRVVDVFTEPGKNKRKRRKSS